MPIYEKNMSEEIVNGLLAGRFAKLYHEMIEFQLVLHVNSRGHS